jgi:hypothetical protein
MKIELHEKYDFVYAKIDAEKSEMKELRSLGLAVMQFHIRELISDLNRVLRLSVNENSSWPQLMNCVDKNYAAKEYIIERWRLHVAAYVTEAVMHVYLGNDWRLVFKYNERFSRGDGVLKDETLYDVYHRGKNRWGLSKKPKAAIQVYVLTHYYGGLVFLVGYATLAELKRGAPEKFGCFSVPISKLHPVSFLKSDYSLGLKQQVDEARLLSLQVEVC